MSRKASINKEHASVENIQDRIKYLEQDIKVLNKLYFINDIYHDISITESCEKLGVSRVTGQTWLKQWNTNGFEGLTRKKGSGGQSKISADQKEKLKKLIKEKEIKTATEVRELIISTFNIEYGIRQVERFLREFQMNYGKPYHIYSKMPEDAEETLKKHSNNQHTKRHRRILRSNSMSKYRKFW